MPMLFLAVSLLSSLIGTAVSLGMMALVLWQAPRQTLNRLLALYLGSIAGWALSGLVYRLTDSTDMLKITAYCFGVSGFLLLLIALRYTCYGPRKLVGAFQGAGGLFFGLVFPVLVTKSNGFLNIDPTAFGGSMFHMGVPGYVMCLLIIVMSLVASALLWRARKRDGGGLLLPTLLAPLGALSMLIPISVPIPMMIAATTSVLLSRVILRQNLFNPLLEVTKVLTASEAHYRAIAEELTRKERLYRTLARNLPNTTVGLFDRDMRCLVFEGQPLTIRGVRIDHSVEGQLLSQVLPPEILQGMVNLYQAAFAGKEVQSQSVFDGRDFHIHALPVSDERGASFAGMIVLQDITDIKEAERQTMALTLEKERNIILRRFIADATHDLMTPISGMQLSVDILRRELKEHPAQKRLESLSAYTHRLTMLLQDMLEATRLDETDSLDLHNHDVNGLVREAVMRVGDAAALRHHRIVVQCGELPPLRVDGLMLNRVFMNLLNNAVAYTPDGGTITVTTSASDDGVLVEVADTGIGIQADDLERIFERFYRVDKARGIEDGGAGLGLSIARRIVELHGGQIDATSAPGKGSAFRVRLPVSVAESVLKTSA